MSADNYYVIKKHPHGGYAAVMGFASDDMRPKVRPNHHHAFPTPAAALEYAHGEYVEYGVRIDPDVLDEMR